MDEVYVRVWDEPTGWHFYKNDFPRENFPLGYVDYWIEVTGGVITFDDFHSANVGKDFNKVYAIELFKEVV